MDNETFQFKIYKNTINKNYENIDINNNIHYQNIISQYSDKIKKERLLNEFCKEKIFHHPVNNEDNNKINIEKSKNIFSMTNSIVSFEIKS